jgi:hypothetical protein
MSDSRYQAFPGLGPVMGMKETSVLPILAVLIAEAALPTASAVIVIAFIPGYVVGVGQRDV